MGIFEDKVRKYNPRLTKDLGINDTQSCGIWGNLGVETGGFKHMQELKPVVKGSRGGYGWMQWTGPRRKKFEAWCTANNMLPASDEANYMYLVHETKTEESASLAALRKTTTLEAATETWMKKNLRPGIPHLASRLQWARKAADALKMKTGTLVAGVTIATGAASVAAVEYAPTNYLPYIFGGMGAIALIAGIIYLIRKNN